HVGPGERSQYDERGDYDRSIAPQHGLDCRIGHVRSAHDAALAEMNLGELGVGVGEFQPDRAGGLAPAAPDFGERVFEPVDHVDADAVLRAGHRIEDWLTAAFGHAGHHQARLSRGDVELEFYR